MPILRIGKDRNVLNEEYAGLSAGYNNITYNTPGFSYSIMPLQFNLCQRGNDNAPKMNNKAYKHFVGELVRGISPYDEKEHKGVIVELYYTVEDNEKPSYCYITDMEDSQRILLYADTVRKCMTPRP